jgi:tetraacyldisaccharide 4'-kinase
MPTFGAEPGRSEPKRFAQVLQTAWFRKNLAVFLWPLLPLSWVFGALGVLRRAFYRRGWLRAERLDVPVVVVGNVIVGGAGKTPLTLWLVEQLRAGGRHPGIISRGYRGTAEAPTEVTAHSDPSQVGDEPVLLARRSGVPVFVAHRRAAAGRALRDAYPEVDVLVCDDGLQHYALGRDVELAVVDSRGAGNGRLLPAGPLREPWQRLREVDAILQNLAGSAAGEVTPAFVPKDVPSFAMRLAPGDFYSLRDPARRCSAEDLRGRQLHALAGIGVPERFFASLRGIGLRCVEHAFPDHHAYTLGDLAFAKGAVLLMTEKDAVKCGPLFTTDNPDAPQAWVLPVSALVDPDLVRLVLEKINGRQTA